MQAANLPQYEKQLQDALVKAKEQLPLTNGWKETDKIKKYNLVNHSKQDETFKAGVTRGEGVININAAKLVEILKDTTQVQKFEKRLKESKLICQTPSGYEVRLQVFSPPIGDDREAITVSGVIVENGTYYVVMTSVEHPEHEKPGKGRTRCYHYYYVYEIVPQGDSACKVTMISCFDPCGSFPDFVKSKMNNSRGIEKLEQIIKYVA